jgi:hypothetical protein
MNIAYNAALQAATAALSASGIQSLARIPGRSALSPSSQERAVPLALSGKGRRSSPPLDQGGEAVRYAMSDQARTKVVITVA